MKYIKHYEVITLGSAVEERKKFEEDVQKVDKEIKPLFYIIEDEGLVVSTRIVVVSMPKSSESIIPLYTVNSLRVSFTSSENHNFLRKQLDGNFRRKLMNSDGVQEFIDRVSEICKKYGYKIFIKRNHSGHWSNNYVDIIKNI